MKKSLLLILSLITIAVQSQNKIESALGETFNGTSWDKSDGVDYEYDSNNNLITQTEYLWKVSSWVANYKTTYTYNTSDKVTERLGKTWNGSQFINYDRAIYTYNAAGLVIQIFDQEWDQTQWKNTYLTDITYNNTLPSIAITTKWNGSQWINETRSTVNYSGSIALGSLDENWDGMQWVLATRNSFTYDANNKRIASFYEIWDGSVWTEYYRTNYELDANNNRSKETEILYGVIQSKSEYNYDLSALMSNFAHPFKDKTGVDYIFEDFPYVNKLLSGHRNIYDNATSTYNFSTRTTLNYNSPLLNTNKFEMRSIKLFPNPSTDFIELSGLIKAEKITIYSILGAKVLEDIIDVNEKINIQNLSNGSYILRFENGNTLKFIKK